MTQPCQSGRERDQKRRDAHDWATLVVLTLTLIAAGCAASFTGWQAWIAQDQERRALRAYVGLTIVPSPEADKEDFPRFLFRLENTGQTPAYRLIVFPKLTILDDTNLFDEAISGDCSYVTGRPIGSNLRKGPVEETYGLDMDTTAAQKALVKSKRYAVRVKGLVCYRDTFEMLRTIRFCRQWYPGWTSMTDCRKVHDQYD